MIRHLHPTTIIEIGSGYSTLFALKALHQNGSGKIICIEPYPMDFIIELAHRGDIELIDKRVQDISQDCFERLSENDILFIDSTHVSKSGSDVNHEIFKILPTIKRGVYAHFHDIFFPWDYPESWLREKMIFWNEQYILSAFLAFNRHFEIVLSSQYIGRELPDVTRESCWVPVDSIPGGGSLWIKRVR